MTSSSWHSPGSIYHIGHKAVKELLTQPCYLTEKVDGSFFAFCQTLDDATDSQYPLLIRSKGAVMNVEVPEKMFAEAAQTVRELYAAGLLHPGWTYRGEYLKKPKHNALAYNRVPTHNIILFDICTDEETYLSYVELANEAARIGLEVVPHLGYVNAEHPLTPERVSKLLETESILGGQKIEGFVLKPNAEPMFGVDKKLLMAKYVSEAFKEVHSNEWKQANPQSGDILERVIKKYATAARWNKAIQHLKEAGQLENEPRDIPKLLKEVVNDVEKEEAQNIADDLFRWAWEKEIRRGLTRGLPEYYKEYLMKEALSHE